VKKHQFITLKKILHDKEHRCRQYLHDRLRPPPEREVLTWARRLGVSRQEARNLSDRLPYRHALGNI